MNKDPYSDRYGQRRSSAAAIKVPLPPLELTKLGTAEGGGGAEAVKQAGSAITGLFGGDKK